MPDLIDVLTRYRNHYLGFYSKVILKFRDSNKKCAAEVLIRADGTNDLPPLFQLWRTDIVIGPKENLRIMEVNHNLPDGEPHKFQIGEMTASIKPLIWNSVEFHCESFDPNSEAFLFWIENWMDIDERKETDELGLGDCVHSVTWPAAEDAGMTFSVDFGSASTAALIELLSILANLGLQKVDVDSNILESAG